MARGSKSAPGQGEAEAEASAPPAGPGGDVYTMAEAARLKGVSYHTVSRAVRRGKLSAQRLGRMALISAEDLQAWRPMRERAPRKYRRREPNPGATPALLDLASGERVELARRLSTLYEVLHGAAAELPLAEFLALLCDRLAGALDFRRAAVWSYGGDGSIARLAAFGPPLSDLPTGVQLTDPEVVHRLVDAPEAFVLPDVAAAFGTSLRSDLHHVTALFVAPLRVGSRVLGFVLGDCNGEPFTLTPAQLGLAQGMANQAALALEQARLRAAEAARADELAAIVENIGEAVLACDAAGRVTLRNAAHRSLLGLDVLSLAQRRELDGTPVPPEDVPMFRALRGEEVRDRQYSIVRADGTTRVISVNARPIRSGDEIVGSVSVARDVTAEREAAQRDAERLAQVEAAAARAAATADVALAVNAGMDLATVLRTAITRMTGLLGGRGGAILFREADGRMTGQVDHHAAGPAITGMDIDIVTLPTTMIAFARAAPLFYTYAEAAPSERVYFDRYGFRAALIVPLIAGEAPIGVAYVDYPTDDRRPSEDDLAFASALGSQCAVAIDKTRLMERLEAAHRRLLAVVDQLPQGVVIVEAPNGRLVLANRAAEALWGAPLAEASEAVPPLGFGDARGTPFAAGDGPLERTLRTGEGGLGEELTITRADGASVVVVANRAPVVDGSGRIVGAVSVLQPASVGRGADSR